MKIRPDEIAKKQNKNNNQTKRKQKQNPLSSKIGERLSKHSLMTPASWSLPICDSVTVRITNWYSVHRVPAYNGTDLTADQS